MLATRGEVVPPGEGWSHEVKWDGIRLLADARDGAAPRLATRNENDCTVAWPELLPGPLPGRDLLVDGEVIGLDARGLPDFGVLQDRMHVRKATTAQRMAAADPATFMVFDVLRLDGRDLTDLPLAERRAVLESLGLDGTWQVPAAYDDGAMLLDATAQQGLEGIVSKRLSSRYEPGARSRHWLKFPHRRRESYVVGGWRPETGSSNRLGSVLVGEPTPDGLVYRGRVGSGIAGKAGPLLLAALEPLARGTSPFAEQVPKVDAVGTRWVEPRLVVDVEALGRSRQDRLRQPAYCGLRPDLDPDQLSEEA